jgi:hypothetical protein
MLAFVVAGGCQEEPMGGPRVPVVPVTGRVLVDGKPEENIAVLFLRTSEKGVEFPVPEPEGITDKQGVIKVGTYYAEDGAAPGEYKLCFLWLAMNRFTGEMSGDKFRGKYDGKDRSRHTVTIPEEAGDDPHDIGTFELSTKRE